MMCFCRVTRLLEAGGQLDWQACAVQVLWWAVPALLVGVRHS